MPAVKPISVPAPPADAAVPDPRAWARIEIAEAIAPLEAAWRALEARALVTPYQSYGWVRAFVETIGSAHAQSVCFVVVKAGDGAVLAILPLVLLRRHGVRFAEFIGGKHANYHMGIYDPAFACALDADTVRRLLGEIGAAIGRLDAFLFINQPVAWNGVANPLALLAAGPSPSRAYKLALLPGDGDGTLRRSMSAHARKKLKNKRNRFADFGQSTLRQARDEAGVTDILDAFFSQKAKRFAAMGVPDPFADPAVRGFLRQAALARAGHAPSIELYSLDLDGRPVATYVGAVQGTRFSGMATSFDMDSDLARTSPGEILLVELIQFKCATGFTMFDLGVGEARYKTTICDDVDELVDSFVPLTAPGRLYAALSRAKRAAKRQIKASPLALKLAQRAAGLLRRNSRPQAVEE